MVGSKVFIPLHLRHASMDGDPEERRTSKNG